MKIKTTGLVTAALLAVVVLVSLAFSTVEQKRVSAKTDYTVKEWERAKAYTKEYLDAATEETFGFKPTPEMRSFGEQMLHLSEANYGMASAASGTPSPIKFGELEKGALKTKAEISKAVLDSYDFAIAAAKGMTDEKLAGNVKMFNMEMTAETALAKAFEHQTHHRGQTTVYLRLKGLKPPQEKLF
ncbi:MAG: damage-inducible protein DinB [Azospira oryzae]|jgi:uncharacterized damage-inducible protein DinB|nr:damage-inducible protein DinB [Cytophaga sp.]PZR41520.1 MAG: damage-inducible protein DinB [Azospira oryzae]